MVDRILIGKRPSDAQVGMWISKPGKDISSSDPDDFLFDPTKYMARAYARLVSGVFVRGEFSHTTTFSDGTKMDRYFYYCTMNIGLPYVPMMVAQLSSQETGPGQFYSGETYYKSDQIVIKTGDLGFWIYNGSDPSKTPTSALVGNSGTWSYNYSQNFITYTKGNNSNFIIYRNPLF